MKSYYDKTIEDITIDDNIDKMCLIPTGYNTKVWNYKLLKAKEDKRWALEKKDDIKWWNMASEMSHSMLLDRLEDGVCKTTKKSYDYFSHRSHAKSKSKFLGYSLWIDRSAKQKWEEITGKKIEEEDIKWIN